MRRFDCSRRAEGYRPQVLILEDRLPPGDAVLGVLLAPGLLGLDLPRENSPAFEMISSSPPAVIRPVGQIASLPLRDGIQAGSLYDATAQVGSLSYGLGGQGSTEYGSITNAPGALAEVAPQHFNPLTSLFAVRSNAAGGVIREGTPAGVPIEVTLAGRPVSREAASTTFDPALADASTHTSELRDNLLWDGLPGPSGLSGKAVPRSSVGWLLATVESEPDSGEAALVLGTQTFAGSVSIHADGPVVVQGAIQAAGTLTIVAPSVIVHGALRAAAVSLVSSGLVNLDAGANVAAGRVDLAGRVVVNAGAIHADGPTGGAVAMHAGNILNGGQVTANGFAGAGGTATIAFTGTYLDTAAARITADGAHGGRVTLDGGTTGRLLSSGIQEARGSAGDGTVVLNSGAVARAGAVGFGLLDAPPEHGGDSDWSITPLANGNVVVVNPHDDFVAPDSGAAYLVNGRTAALLGALLGSATDDEVGGGDEATGSDDGPRAQFQVSSGGVTAMSNGNYVVASPHWRKNRGAATWGDGTMGTTGLVNHHTSLIGSNPGDQVSLHVTALSNGNYVVASPNWNGRLGAATWGNGTGGTIGAVNPGNSLVGSNPGDLVGFGGVTALTNGNYVVNSSHWSGVGAATWGDGSAGITGTIDASNSLVGSHPGDGVAAGGLTALTNGNYVVDSPGWNGALGAVTWGDGSAGTTGTIDAGNSLVGNHPVDQVGLSGVRALANGNYVVCSQFWNDDRGAATWGDGSMGVSGTIDGTNSLIGSASGDQVGNFGVTPLTNGNYVVASPYWNGGTINGVGAATWGDGSMGVTGTIDVSNSLIGNQPKDHVAISGVTALSNGNYVVPTPSWNGGPDNGVGAATWADGGVGVTGMIDSGNSLVGSHPGDQVGSTILALSNGNYVVISPSWNGGPDNGLGAATWGDGTRGIAGTVDATNSLVGSSAGDRVGFYSNAALSNGNYVIGSPFWTGFRGAATWGDGSAGTTGTVGMSNSLVGNNPQDQVGGYGITALRNGNYVVDSPNWHGFLGAVTWGDGTRGITGTIDAGNSLVGNNPNDEVGGGSFGGVTALTNGNYVVHSPFWDGGFVNGVGAATWSDGTAGITGTIDATNSLIGSNPGDHVGGGSTGGGTGGGVVALANGNYVVASPTWSGNHGAATWGDGTAGVTGMVDNTNSLVG